MNAWLRTVSWLAVALSTVGCGDDGSGEGGAGGDGAASSGASTTASSTTSVTSSTGVGAPPAPVLDMVEPMHGALHLFWTNTAPDCDMVEGERKLDAAAYTVFFSVPGTVDNEMDDGATDPTITYTYRLRCLKGSASSPYSNEVSNSPMP